MICLHERAKLVMIWFEMSMYNRKIAGKLKYDLRSSQPRILIAWIKFMTSCITIIILSISLSCSR